MKFKRIADIVKDILINDECARSSDKYLYYKVLEKISADWLKMSVKDFLLNADSAPAFETVRRVRQKIQEQNSSLKAVERVRKYRRENEKEYIQFARSYES